MEFNFEILECANPKYAKHYLKNPITLSCGHCVCKGCTPLYEEDKLTCRICNEENKIDLELMQESKIVNQMLNLHLNELFKNLERNFNQILPKLQENIDGAKERINLQFDYVKEEIEIRVESLKIELDNICQEMNKDLEEKRKDYINLIEESSNHVKFGQQTLIRLAKKQNTDEVNQSLDNLYEYDDVLTNLRQLNQNLDNITTKVVFEQSKPTLDSDVIGNILYNDPLLIAVRNGVCFQKQLVDISWKIDVLSENCFLIKNCVPDVTQKYSLFDENYKLIKVIDKINGKPFRSCDITSNLNDRLFYTDNFNHTVSSLDFDFNLIRTVGSLGSCKGEFNGPYGICYNDGFLYVCDSKNSRIQVLDTHLNFQKTHMVDCKPWSIKIIKNTACIRAFGQKSIYFYETTTFKQIYKYDGHYGFLCNVNNLYFFELFGETLYCYNSDGTFKESVELLFENKYRFCGFDGFCCFKGKLMLSYNNKLIII